ncbi:MAG: bifunctional phosphoribosylaminoimidazolecarboxamide formyltransferase/IMP cyclohydrolase [Gaiellales bacterium]
MSVRRALLSAYDKTGVLAFAKALYELGVELVASGGTAELIAGDGLPVTTVADLTGMPELLGHRVVTLHPGVHGGILARRDVETDLADLEMHGIATIDLVYVNLYPFERTVSRLDVEWAEAIEQIDIGGPAMLRAAAKNHAFVVPLCRPDDFELVLLQLRAGGDVDLETRRALAARAFARTGSYDAAVASWFTRDEQFPETILPVLDLTLPVPYGENPHQQGAYYAERGARMHVLSRVDQLQGRPLSYNNVNDLSAARLLASSFEQPSCVIVKHANPCGVAVAETIEDAYARALAADPVSAYGGIVVLNRPVSAALGEALAGQFLEVVFAPGYDAVAVDSLARRPDLRVLSDNERRAFTPGERDLKRVIGGVLVQDRDVELDPLDAMNVACGDLDEEAWEELLFAWAVARQVASNAIVISNGRQTLGIGAGQMSRVDAVRLAIDKAREHGHDLAGAALASDAFFPFADGAKLAVDAGVTRIIQPGGSKRDDEVVAAVRDAGATMVLAGRRHFRH